MLVESRSLARDSTFVLEAELSEDTIMVIYVSVYLSTSDYGVTIDFRVDSTSSTVSFKQCNVMMI